MRSANPELRRTMNYNHYNWKRAKFALQQLPSIRDENEPGRIQDFCDLLNLPTSEDTVAGPLEVRSSNNEGLGQLFEGRRRTTSFNLGRKKLSSADQLSRLGRSKFIDGRRSFSLSGRTKKFPRENEWNYKPKLIDLSVLEDVEKLALDFFTNGLQADGETLEKTMERIYGGEDADRCFEFTQVGNCGPFSSQKVKVIKNRTLPEIAASKEREIFEKNMRRMKRKPKIHLPSIFEVSYSRPLSLQTKNSRFY